MYVPQVIHINRPLLCLKETKESIAKVANETTAWLKQAAASEQSAEHGPPSIHIVDPTSALNNVGRTAFRFHEVQQVCQKTLYAYHVGLG